MNLTSSSARSRKLRIHEWPWWKALSASALLYAPFSAFLLIIPPYFSASAWLSAGMLVAAGVIVLNWGRYGDPWWSEVAASFVFTLQFLVIGIRAGALLAEPSWTWIGPLVAAFLLAWSLPVLRPELAYRLWRAQMAPRTKWGQRAYKLFVGLVPISGVLGASFGLLSGRTGQTPLAWAVLAALACLVAVGWGQTTAQQLFDKR